MEIEMKRGKCKCCGQETVISVSNNLCFSCIMDNTTSNDADREMVGGDADFFDGDIGFK